MSANCDSGSHVSRDGSGAGSGMSALSAIGRGHFSSVPSPCSLSDLDDYNLTKFPPTPKRDSVAGGGIPVSSNAGRFSFRVIGPDLAENRGASVADFNIPSKKDLAEEVGDSGTKSTKKRSTLGLNFNIQLFKGARQRFNKKKESEVVGKTHSTGKNRAPSKIRARNEVKSLDGVNNFFPHLLRSPVGTHNSSHALHPSRPQAVNSLIYGLPATKTPPTPSFIPLPEGRKGDSRRNVNKSEKEKQKKTNLENGSEDVKLENGNWGRGDTEVKFKRALLSHKNTFLVKDYRHPEENDVADCFCHFTNQNRRWFRKKKPINFRCKSGEWETERSRYIYDESSSSEYKDGSGLRYPAEANPGRLKSRLGEATDRQPPAASGSGRGGACPASNSHSRNRPNFLRKSLVLPTATHGVRSEKLLGTLEPTGSQMSSSDNYDVTSDEEGDVETSLTSSDEGLTSNLSLFTSAEGEEDVLASLPRFYDRKGFDRENDCNNSLNGWDFTPRPGDVTPREARNLTPSCMTKWNICQDVNLPDQNSTLATTLPMTIGDITWENRSKFSDYNKDCIYPLKNVVINNSPTKGMKLARENRNSKLERQGEEIYPEKRYLATHSYRDASIGISPTAINNELTMQNEFDSDAHIGSYLNCFNTDSWLGKLHQSPRTLFSSLYPYFVEEDTKKVKLAHARIERESGAKLDSVTQQYEERITELHSVIAELTRKLDRQREDVILEEDEEDDEEGKKERRGTNRSGKENEDRTSLSEFSSQEQNESNESSTSETAESEGIFEREETTGDTNPRPSTDISTSGEIDDRAVEAGECIADLDVIGCRAASNHSNLSPSQLFPDNDDVTADDAICQGSSSAGLEEELKLLREENSNLQQVLAMTQNKVTNQRSAIMGLSREREILKKKLKEFEKMQPGIPLSLPHISDAIMVKGLRGSPFSVGHSTSVGPPIDTGLHGSSRAASPSVASQPQDEDCSGQDGVRVICKLAERVRLKKAESGDLRVTGSDLSVVGVSTTGVAEQLSASVQEESDAQELFHALATAGGAFAPHERLKEYELEAERLHARIDHLRSQNEVLSATLGESKACCDRLALKTGRAEAQSGALKMGVVVLDQIQEAFEVLTALHEAQIALLVVTCQATGVELGEEMGFDPGEQDIDPLIRVRRAQDQRRTAENVARHLISRLQEMSTSPGLESNGHHSMSSSTSSVSSKSAHQEEYMLRGMISRLQEERTRILSCIKGSSDSSPGEDYFPIKPPLNDVEAHKLDLENAVLMQELTAIREDRAELRAQVYLLEREKAGLELRIGTCEAQTTAYSITIDHLKSQLNQVKCQTNTSHESVGDSGVDTSSSEVESLRRENQLKSRVDDLVVTLEKVTKNSEARHQQSQDFISDLKKANSALLTAVDRLKKKYTLRVRRMEQQTANLVSKHEQQVKSLGLRIATLENQLRSDVMPSHQTNSGDGSY